MSERLGQVQVERTSALECKSLDALCAWSPQRAWVPVFSCEDKLLPTAPSQSVCQQGTVRTSWSQKSSCGRGRSSFISRAGVHLPIPLPPLAPSSGKGSALAANQPLPSHCEVSFFMRPGNCRRTVSACRSLCFRRGDGVMEAREWQEAANRVVISPRTFYGIVAGR